MFFLKTQGKFLGNFCGNPVKGKESKRNENKGYLNYSSSTTSTGMCVLCSLQIII